MGFFSSYESEQYQNGGYDPYQYAAYPNQYTAEQNQNQVAADQNQVNTNKNQAASEQKEKKKEVIPKPIIKLPDPKLFEFDPNFLKNCENIEKKTTAEGEIEGQMKNGILNGKGRIVYKSGAI